jgi:hypothetical protein
MLYRPETDDIRAWCSFTVEGAYVVTGSADLATSTAGAGSGSAGAAGVSDRD